MHEYTATISWKRNGPDFINGKYSRVHTWAFDGGFVVPASPAPTSVRIPFSDPANVDPEEAYVASISSCHMLTYLYLASKQGFTVDSYDDDAKGFMAKNEQGAPWIESVVLSPRIAYGGDRRPTPDEEDHLHHASHEQCYIANSVRTKITVKR